MTNFDQKCEELAHALCKIEFDSNMSRAAVFGMNYIAIIDITIKEIERTKESKQRDFALKRLKDFREQIINVTNEFKSSCELHEMANKNPAFSEYLQEMIDKQKEGNL